MADPNIVPQIFDEELRKLHRARALARLETDKLPFFLMRCIEDFAERLTDINRRFEHGVILGDMDIRPALTKVLPAIKTPKTLTLVKKLHALDALQAPIDLIVSLLFLQSENDLPGTLKRMADKLNPDGLMIVCLFGGETLTEFREALYSADEAVLGGLTARISPMTTYEQAAQLLSRARLNLPVVDIDRFKVNYSTLPKLLGDLRDVGQSNHLAARTRRPLTKSYLSHLKKALFAQDEKITTSFEIIWMTGWSPHESQQKPLKPGSARMRLADALRTDKNTMNP